MSLWGSCIAINSAASVIGLLATARPTQHLGKRWDPFTHVFSFLSALDCHCRKVDLKDQCFSRGQTQQASKPGFYYLLPSWSPCSSQVLITSQSKANPDSSLLIDWQYCRRHDSHLAFTVSWEFTTSCQAFTWHLVQLLNKNWHWKLHATICIKGANGKLLIPWKYHILWYSVKRE